ncbi:MAG: DUF4840 domain-containing protein [Bacteroidaceae bacterium]
MKIKEVIGILMLFLSAFSLTSCNKEEEGFSKEKIQQALFDMKGTYHGMVKVSYYHGSSITEEQNAVARSRDSLQLSISLLPIAEITTDKSLSECLQSIGEVQVTAGYEFSQMDYGNLSFALHPQNVIVSGGNDTSHTIKIVFSQIFGGDATPYHNFIMFNLSPTELWFDGKEYENFKQLVYHFKGECE